MPEILGDMITAYRDLFTKGSIKSTTPKNLGSIGRLLKTYFGDLQSRGDSFLRSWSILTSKADLFTRTWPNAQSGGNITKAGFEDLNTQGDLFSRSWPVVRSKGQMEARTPKGIGSKGHVEQEEFVSPKVILERQDLRAQFPKHPIARLKISVGVPIAYEKVYSSFDFNAGIRQIVLEIPSLGGDSLKLQLLDEIGTVLYESGTQTEDQKVSILLTTPIPLVGKPSIGILLSGVQGVARTIVVYLYGR